ncbi:hypothetical protein ACFFUZ_47905 [Kibdelosporangium philippinense]
MATAPSVPVEVNAVHLDSAVRVPMSVHSASAVAKAASLTL